MASSTPVCGICDLRHISKSSEVWCSECDEGLCVDCKEHHGLSKSSRKHRTLPITEYLRLPENILEIREYCEEHNEKYQLFCKQHDCPCCRLCTMDRHSKCEDVTAIERIIQDVKTSNTFQETEHLIKEILDTIVKIRKNRTDNLSSLQQHRKTVVKEILAARTKINKHLDQIQKTIMNELAEIETNVQKQTNDVLTSLSAKEKQLNDYQTTTSSIKQYATDLQTFLSIRGVERGVAGIDKSLHTLLETDTMNNTTLSCQIDKVVQQFPAKFPTLGKVIVQSHPLELTISRRKNKQAQIMVVTTPSRSIENITLELQQKIHTQVLDTRGCVLLPDGRMMFSCYNKNRVRSINKDGSQDFDTGKLSSVTFDITYIEDTNTIAATSGCNVSRQSQCISIIDMVSGQIKKTIPVKSDCYGIVYRNNTLIYCDKYKGLRMINLNDESVNDVFVAEMSYHAYVATYRDKLYYTNRDTHTVTCCDLHGNIQWQFKDESILSCPLGITVDNDGNVYVIGQSSNNVVVISSDGQHRRQLLGKEDGLDYPRVLHYENSTTQLLVANQSDIALLFQVARSTNKRRTSECKTFIETPLTIHDIEV